MKESRGPMRAIKAAQYSWQGFRAAFQNEEAFRQELTLCLLLAPLAFWLGETGLETAFMLSTLVLVLITELLNSAVEAVVDRVGTEHHELSGRAKDIGSAAVTLSLINVPISWALIYFL